MIYRELALPTVVQGAALCAWEFLMEPHDPPLVQHQVPPDGTTNLLLTRAPDQSLHSRLIGPSLAAVTVPVMQGFHYCGLRLRPEAARLVTGNDPTPGTVKDAATTDRFAPVWRDLAALIEGDCDWEGSRTLLGGIEGDACVGAAVDRLIVSGGAWPVAHLAIAAGVSERQFRRRFHAATGMSPKQYSDVQRVRCALILSLSDPNWAGIAHEAGFADQPHLAREIKQRFGAAPRRVRGYLGGIRHELLDWADGRKLQETSAEAA